MVRGEPVDHAELAIDSDGIYRCLGGAVNAAEPMKLLNYEHAPAAILTQERGWQVDPGETGAGRGRLCRGIPLRSFCALRRLPLFPNRIHAL